MAALARLSSCTLSYVCLRFGNIPSNMTSASRMMYHIPTGFYPVKDKDCLAPLPYRKTLPSGLQLRVEPMQPEHKPEIVQIMNDTMTAGLGIGPEDFGDHNRWDRFIDTVPTFAFIDESTERVFGATTISPSPASRSQVPIANGSWLLLHRDYRKSGAVHFWILMSEALAADMGYMGLGVRAGLRSPVLSLVGGVPGPFQYTSAIIHREQFVGDNRYASTLICYCPYTMRKDYSLVFKQMEHTRLSTPLPPLAVTDAVPVFLHDPLHAGPTRTHLAGDKYVTCKSASDSDVWKVELLIRDFASRGEYFAWDEFTDDGFFNRRFLKKTHILTAVTSSGEVTGAALFGPSAISRGSRAANATLYVFVSPGFREQGIGGTLLDLATDTITELGYAGISTDLFSNCQPGMALLRNKGFVPCGSLVNTACVKDIGFCDSFVFYKDLEQFPLELSKL